MCRSRGSPGQNRSVGGFVLMLTKVEMQLTGDRFFSASPTVRLRSSYTPPLIRVTTSTASKTLYRTPSARVSTAKNTRSGQVPPTFRVQNWHAGYASLHKDVNHVDDRGIHGGGGQVVVGAQEDLTQRFAQPLRVAHIDGDEFENPVLGDDAEDVGSIGLAVVGDEGNATGAGL